MGTPVKFILTVQQSTFKLWDVWMYCTVHLAPSLYFAGKMEKKCSELLKRPNINGNMVYRKKEVNIWYDYLCSSTHPELC